MGNVFSYFDRQRENLRLEFERQREHFRLEFERIRQVWQRDMEEWEEIRQGWDEIVVLLGVARREMARETVEAFDHVFKRWPRLTF